MKGYLRNPEIKRSFTVLLVLFTIFLLSNYLVIKQNHEQLKNDYIQLLGGMTSKIIENHPDLEEEIVPLMTKELTETEVKKGQEILSQYGLSEKLELNLVPYVNQSYKDSLINLLLLGISLIGALFILNYVQFRYFYKSMRTFSTAANRIVDGDYDLKLSETKEGDLSKLTQSFNAMGEVIRGNIHALKREKVFLVDLLSDISHQLKTPLSTMILYNDLLLTKELSKEQQVIFLENNQSQLNRMKWLIQNLLKLAKIDANAIELEMEEQGLVETMKEVTEILESKALENEVKVEIEAENNEISFKHDRLWLQEAFLNIVKNGIEHSYKGETVGISIEENPAFVRVTIKNQGEPLSEENLANIFKRFYKGKDSKKSDSIGIGLSLAKSIIEKHGGYIEAKSNMEEGTRFIVTFIKY